MNQKRTLGNWNSAFSAWLVSLIFCASQAVALPRLDSSFGIEGIVTTDFGGAYDELEGVAVQSDGTILAVGTGGSSNRMQVARYLPNGQLDSTLDHDGKLLVPYSASSPAIHALPEGKFLLGVPDLRSTRGFRAMQYNADGTPDASFGVNGTGFIEVESQVYIRDMLVHPDGRILIGGYDIFNSDWDFVLTQFTSTGQPDTTFGTNGRVVTNFSREGVSSPSDNLESLLLLPDGHILAGGHTNTESGSNGDYVHAISKYLPSGLPDTTFGTNGQQVLRLSNQAYGLEEITDMVLLENGKILATSGVSSETVLVRLNPDGSLDSTFGSGGRIIAPPWRIVERPHRHAAGLPGKDFTRWGQHIFRYSAAFRWYA